MNSSTKLHRTRPSLCLCAQQLSFRRRTRTPERVRTSIQSSGAKQWGRNSMDW